MVGISCPQGMDAAKAHIARGFEGFRMRRMRLLLSGHARLVGLPLLLVVPFSLILSCLVISRTKLFDNDELGSHYLLSDASYRHMWAAFNDSINNSPPLYFAIGWIWAALFGPSETSLRLFTSLAMSFAPLLLWGALRAAFGNVASILGLVLTFSSTLVLSQNANARPYGLFVACTALCVTVIAHNERPSLSSRSFVINATSFALLAQSHLFGPIYAVALIAAQVVHDARFSRWRPFLYLAMIIGIGSFALYLPILLNQAEASTPRFWIPIAFFQDLSVFYASIVPVSLNSDVWYLGQPIAASTVMESTLWIILFVVGSFATFYWPSSKDSLEVRCKQQLLLMIAWTLLLLPIAVWFGSWAIKPLFVYKYMLPSVLGLAILYAAVSSRFLILLLSSAEGRLRLATDAAAVMVVLCVGWTSLLWAAQKFPNDWIPGSGDNRY